jgi:hypothetical protein
VLKHASTSLPSNCDDRDLQIKPPSEVTANAFTIVMARISMLIPELVDGLSALSAPMARYEHVIAIDGRMRTLVSGIPPILLSRVRDASARDPPWLDLARRTLAITAADKIIMIHRPFLLRSFETPMFLFTRNTCVSAAMTILREHQSITDSSPSCVPIWCHSAFCVTAVVVLCLNMLHGGLSRQSCEHQTSLVAQARVRLSAHTNDTMAKRGVHLIDAMLEGNSEMDGRMGLRRVFERFWALDQLGMHQQREESLSTPYEFACADQPEDFDAWFHQAFQV